LRYVKSFGDEIKIGKKEYPVNHENLMNALYKFRNADNSGSGEIDGLSKRYWIGKNVLFFDPVEDILRPQSKADPVAIREVLKRCRNEK